MVDKSKESKAADAMGEAPSDAPQVAMLAQYIRDLSFENPNAPASLQNESGTAPAVDVNVRVNGRKAGDDIYEIELSLNITSKAADQVQYIVELKYASLFGIRNLPDDMTNKIVLIQGPTLMFPFARRIIADAVRDGGFPPLLLDPVNFEALYAQQAAQQGAAPSGGEGDSENTIN